MIKKNYKRQRPTYHKIFEDQKLVKAHENSNYPFKLL